MKKDNKKVFLAGLRNGIPIGLGYFFVSFSLGITAKETGLNPFQAALMSFSIHASAGEFAALTIIGAGAGYIEMAFTELVINLRYMLMSCALSQKLSPKTKFYHRFFVAFDITDEIFAVSATSENGKLNPFFVYGLMCAASPGWVLGTFIGAAVGGILPAVVVGAMSIALYGMFISVIVPEARGDKATAAVVIGAMLTSGAFSVIPVLCKLSSGMKIIIITVLISALAAIIFPIEKAGDNDAE